MPDLAPFIARYERELLENVVPFWSKHAIDRECGGYFSFLDEDGSVYDTEKPMWMQWRMVQTFATLSIAYRRPEWLELARHGYAFLTRHGKDGEGNYYFALNRQGVPTAAAHSIYSECFAAMGSAALHQATRDPAHRAEAEGAMARYLARMENPKGRWSKVLEGRKRRLALGPTMILSNLGLVLSDCLGEPKWENESYAAAKTMLEKFWDPARNLFFENALPGGGFDLDSSEGRLIHPGHGLEGMWFAMELAQRRGDKAMLATAAQVTERLLELGWDKEHGGIFYFLDALGRPPKELTWNMKLWWVHNEALVAALYAWRATGDERFWDWFTKLDAWTWSHFPDAKHGEWYGYLNRDGSLSHRLKGGQWKCFFHLPRCLLTCLKLMRG